MARERPILFSAPMVRALLAGTKTQTRRAINPQPFIDELRNFHWNGWNYGQSVYGEPHVQAIASPLPQSRTNRVLCPFGKPGDRLWVRETWKPHSTFADRKPSGIPPSHVFYAADERYAPSNTPWVPSIHMPRWASRITLEITDVRVQRLQDISEEDAIAEGCTEKAAETHQDDDRLREECGYFPPSSHEHAFRLLWESINGAASWDANPFVWALTFRRVET